MPNLNPEQEAAIRMDFDQPVRTPFTKDQVVEKRAKILIPVLPKAEPPLSDSDERRGVSNRARAAANLKVEGCSYQEIADLLELNDAKEAKRLVESVLAAIHGPGDLETLRMVVSARAERLFRQSLAMASADFLVDRKTGKKLPNPDKLRWHQQASNDLMNLAAITGAKAPTKVEITPGEADYDKIVDMMLRRAGIEEVVEADVLELEAVPLADRENDDEEPDDDDDDDEDDDE